MAIKRKTRRITHRTPSDSYVKQMNETADEMLAQCARMFEHSHFDTAVRDTLFTGVAYVLHAAYDCKACALGIEGEEFCTYIEACVGQWFRDRDFTEWFCVASARLFRTSDPRRLVREWTVRRSA